MRSQASSISTSVTTTDYSLIFLRLKDGKAFLRCCWRWICTPKPVPISSQLFDAEHQHGRDHERLIIFRCPKTEVFSHGTTTLWHNALGAPYLHRLFAGRLVCIWSHTLKSRTSHAIVGTFGFVKHQVPVCTYCRSGLTRGWCVQGYQDPYPQV